MIKIRDSRHIKGWRALSVLAIVLLYSASAGMGLWWSRPPEMKGANVPGEEFSAERAMKHIHALGRKPRIPGNHAWSAGRDYILRYLELLGFQPHVQKVTSCRTWFPDFHVAGRMENVVMRIPGKNPGHAILLVGHYDTVPHSPGASDDGAAVAALLETARALSFIQPPLHDIIFLFTDGEEAGLLGAAAFAREHPWMKDVRFVVNLEARGTGGASLLFETGPGSGTYIREYARTASSPTGNSLTSAVYALLSNDTDFTVFLERGMPGFNFAFIEGVSAYHTALDNPDRLDPRSLQHHGEQALSLARIFGTRPSVPDRGEPCVYFTLPGGPMVVYSTSAAYTVGVITVLLLAALTLLALKRSLLSAAGTGKALGFVLLFSSLLPAVVFLLWKALTLLHENYQYMVMGDTYNAGVYRLAFTVLALCMTALFVRMVLRWVSPLELFQAGLWLWALLLSLTLVFLPGASFMFQAPLALSLLLFMALILFWPGKGKGREFVQVLVLLPVPFFLGDLIASFYSGLTLNFAAIAVWAAGLGFLLLVPVICQGLDRAGYFLPVISGTMFLALLAAGSVTSGFGPETPRPTSVAYGWDSNSRMAVWMSCDPARKGWSEQFFGERPRRESPGIFFPIMKNCLFRGYPPLAADAPPVALSPPSVSGAWADRPGGRELRLRVRPGRACDTLLLFMGPSSGVREVFLEGRSLVRKPAGRLRAGQKLILSEVDFRDDMALRFVNPGEGFEVVLVTEPGVRVRVRAVNQGFGLEPLLFKPRGRDSIPSPDFVITDMTMAAARYEF